MLCISIKYSHLFFFGSYVINQLRLHSNKLMKVDIPKFDIKILLGRTTPKFYRKDVIKQCLAVLI